MSVVLDLMVFELPIYYSFFEGTHDKCSARHSWKVQVDLHFWIYRDYHREFYEQVGVASSTCV